MAAADPSKPTPLGVARARFVDGLKRKSKELRGSLALLAATPSEERPREEMRRRLHALYASAQVFQLESLAAALKEAIARLDHARDEKRALVGDDLDVLAKLAANLPKMGMEVPKPSAMGAPPVPAMLRGRGGKAKRGAAAAPVEDALVPGPASPPATPTASAPAHDEPQPAAHAPPPVPGPAPAAKRAAKKARAAAAAEQPSLAVGAPLPAVLAPEAAPPAPADHAAPASRASVLSVLVLDAPEVQARVRALLSGERYEVLGATEPEEALRLARSSAPDVVLAEQHFLTRIGSDFVRRLREDPLTDFVPVVALLPPGSEVDPIALRELGAADGLAKPLEQEPLDKMVETFGGGATAALPGGLGGELTVEEIAHRIADEITRGLVDAADAGRAVSVPLGDGSEVLAAAWSAIGRVRAHVAQRSGGRVHFRELGGAPSTLALVDEEDEALEEPSSSVSLRDRRILVVDDDPAVAWFFTGLLKEHGAIAEDASDGKAALEAARATRPDVIISDILMPEVDGFGLLREVKRDPALASVPVILLSWKEDFLLRMRELQAGASGYLKKEAAGHQAIAAVREVLRPRARLEARVRAGGDVRGRLERIGVIPLLRTVAQLRPDARITVRDAWNLFEVDLRGGQLVDVTRTAGDGSFSRGPRAILPLLGATDGRYTVADADGAVRASIKKPLDALLVEAALELGAVVDAVSGRGLALAAKVELDPDVVASMSSVSTGNMADVVRALGEGRGPRDLLLDGAHAPDELESVLVDLARQGAITAVLGANGEDRVEACRRARSVTRLPQRTPSLAPGAPRPEAEAAGEDATTTPGTTRAPEDGLPEIPALPPLPAVEAAEPAKAPEAAAAKKAPPPPPAAAQAPASDADATLSDAEPPVVERAVEPKAEPKPVEPKAEAKAASASATVRTASTPRTRSGEVPVAKRATKPPAPPAKAADPDSGLGVLGWTFLLALLCIVGFVGYTLLFSPPSGDAGTASPEVADAGPATASGEGEGEGEGGPDVDLGEEPVAPEGPARAGYGEDVAGTAGVSVGAGEGALVVQGRAGTAASVHVVATDGPTDESLELAPGGTASLGLPPGLYELTFVVGDQTSIRFTRVVGGRTRRVPLPE